MTVAEVRELDSAPSLSALYPKAAAGATAYPVLRRVPLLGGRFRAADGLPDAGLALRDIEIDPGHLAAYDRVCGFRLRDELPVTYPHMLAFPLQVALMTDRAFPFTVLGLVHVRNRIDQVRPIRSEERLGLSVRAEDLRPHDRGTQFDLVAAATVGGERVWHSRSTYLHREGSGSSGREREDDVDVPEPNAVWELPADLGRRYGAVSGDRNPIHLHQLTARLFGMSRPIAHGMWTKARALAALEGSLPDALAVDVSFKLPVPLPSRVAFRTRAADGGRVFSIRAAADGRPHLEGRVEPRPA